MKTVRGHGHLELALKLVAAIVFVAAEAHGLGDDVVVEVALEVAVEVDGAACVDALNVDRLDGVGAKGQALVVIRAVDAGLSQVGLHARGLREDAHLDVAGVGVDGGGSGGATGEEGRDGGDEEGRGKHFDGVWEGFEDGGLSRL